MASRLFFWVALLLPVLATGTRHRVLALAIAVGITIPVAYLAFRSTTSEFPSGSVFRYDRSWGLVTHFCFDEDGDGRVDEEAWYSWSEPMMDAHSSVLSQKFV